MATQIEAEEVQELTIASLLAAANECWERLEAVLPNLAPALDAGPDEGGWDPRHVLSHLVGAWQRIPVHCAFWLAAASDIPVPVQFHNAYWIPEWETAPIESFAAAMKAAYVGTWLFIQELAPGSLTVTRPSTLGTVTLGDLIFTSLKLHIADFHIPQLEAFIR